MAQERYSLFPARFVHAGGNLDFVQFGSLAIESGNTHTEAYVSGLVDRQTSLLSHADPTVTLRTADMATILTDVDLNVGLNTNAPSSAWMQNRAPGGVFQGQAALLHQHIVLQRGHLCVDRIQVSQDDVAGAMLELTYYPLWAPADLVEPISITKDQALPVDLVPAFTSQFYLGPVYISGAPLEGVQSIEFTTGVRFEPKRADGDPWARKGSIVRREAMITITFDGTPVPASFFNSTPGTDVDIYFRRGDACGVRIADDVANHMKVTIPASCWNVNTFNGEGTTDMTHVIELRPNGTMSFNLATEIPTGP